MTGGIKIKWGKITSNNNEYHDVLISNGVIEERDYNRLKEEFGTSHKIGDWEIDKLIQYNPDVIIIGTGYFGAVEVPNELKDRIQKNKFELKFLKSPAAIKEYNSLLSKGKKVNALIHSTC